MKGSKGGVPDFVNPGEEQAFALFNGILEAYAKHSGPIDPSRPPNVEVHHALQSLTVSSCVRAAHKWQVTRHLSDCRSYWNGPRRIRTSFTAQWRAGKTVSLTRKSRLSRHLEASTPELSSLFSFAQFTHRLALSCHVLDAEPLQVSGLGEAHGPPRDQKGAVLPLRRARGLRSYRPRGLS